MLKSFYTKYKISLLFSIIIIALYASFAYDLERHDFVKLISLYAALFFLSYKLIQFNSGDFKFLLIVGILLRLVFIAAMPNLSQDFFRFIWDGRLISNFINPYLFTPVEYIANGEFKIAQAEKLIAGMGELSAKNYSNYPPVNQWLFSIIGFLFGKSIVGSVIGFRLLMILADVGIFFLARKLLQYIGKDTNAIWWYFLNPFIIIELTGNLHFEGVMLFFLLASIYMLLKNKWMLSAILIGVSVSVKLLPLLFLPLFFQYFIKRKESKTQPHHVLKLIAYYVFVFLTLIVTFLPFLSEELIQNYSQTIALWFQKFEFNASIYYLLRWVGYQLVGWNTIAVLGKILPLLVFMIVLGLSFVRKNTSVKQLFSAMLLSSLCYFSLATTVHAWYIATPLLLSIFTHYRFAVVWSFVAFFSYSAYTEAGFQENYWLIAIEYLVLFTIAITEFFPHQVQKILTQYKRYVHK